MKLIQKLKEVPTKVKGFIAAGGVGSAFMAASVSAFADTNEAVSAAQTLMSNITSTLNITNVVAILSAGLGAVVGLFLAWWGARKLANMVFNVFRKGKIKF